MKYLNHSEKFLKEKDAFNTAKEIAQQPELWKNTADKFFEASLQIMAFIESAYREADTIFLTGAGTSAFIGLSLQGSFFRNTKIVSRALATTDIVSHPQDYFNGVQKPLIISFARSGNSPESIAALELADKFSKKCFHFIITCDKNGALANYQSNNPAYIFVLPGEANDLSLAMTGSYTSMLLTGLLLANIQQRNYCEMQLNLACNNVEKLLEDDIISLQHIAGKNFQRAVFLGSGPLYGTATEAALKLQELTDGQVICKADTFLGFRHGPKAVIDDTTLVVYFFSNNEYVKQYESDLVQSMKNGNSAMFQLGVSNQYVTTHTLDSQINFAVDSSFLAEDFLPLCYILVAQLIGIYKSLLLGLMPDAPSASGAISRVVEGVHIYPVETHV